MLLTWIHFIPGFAFNGFLEMFSPDFPELFFIIPIVLTDGLIGGLFTMILRIRFLQNINIWIFLIITFLLYQLCVHAIIPPVRIY